MENKGFYDITWTCGVVNNFYRANKHACRLVQYYLQIGPQKLVDALRAKRFWVWDKYKLFIKTVQKWKFKYDPEDLTDFHECKTNLMYMFAEIMDKHNARHPEQFITFADYGFELIQELNFG